MQESEEKELIGLITASMLDGQPGIKVRAFLAFNRGHALATPENLENLKNRGAILITDDTIFPIITL